MTDFIIIERLAKTSRECLIHVLGIKDLIRKPAIYNLDTGMIKPMLLSKEFLIKNFKEFGTEKDITSSQLDSWLEMPEIPLLNFEINHFNPDEMPSIRTMTYTFLNKETGQLFTPCCGRHNDHEYIKDTWGTYKNDIEISPGVEIEGYIIRNKSKFDEHMTGLKLSNHTSQNYIGIKYKDVLTSEFRDYLQDYLSAEGEYPTLILRYPSGVEVSIKL